jgi:hypothetical protein
MSRKKAKPRNDKISDDFAARLERLGPRRKVRAIVILNLDILSRAEKSTVRRRSHSSRAATMNQIRRAAAQALTDVDEILSRHMGRRLRKTPDALGSIPVETTTAGIAALAASKHVRAILEDQAIALIA